MFSNSIVEKQDFVVKANALIEARYRLSLQESQVVLWLLTQINTNDEDFKPHKLDIIEFAKIVGVGIESKYRELRQVTKKLMQRVMEIHSVEENKTIQISWLSSVEYLHNKGVVLLKFDPGLKPYLLQLKSHFTKINIVDTLKLKSIYAIRLFELLLQYVSVGRRKITIKNLRDFCGIKTKEYGNYFDLKLKVIEKAKSEINTKTEYEINYKEIKESRKVVEIEWTIKKKDSEDVKLKNKIQTIERELNYKHVLVKDLMDYGFSKSLSLKLVRENEEIVIKDALSAVYIQMEREQVKNPKAMIRTAISEKWHPQVYRKKNFN